MIAPEVLATDQVFQLNVFLWSVEDLPLEADINPALRQAGYYLAAIGRRVIAPTDASILDALRSVREEIDRTPVRPDLWLKHQSDPGEVLIELKARGFSESSSTAHQALKLIAFAADLAPSLGIPGPTPGHVVYATPAIDAEGMGATLSTLRSALEAVEVPTASTGALGLTCDDGGIGIFSPQPADLPPAASRAIAEPVVIVPTPDEGNDLRPLYFVPWIPGIEEQQDATLAAEGFSELTARLLTETVTEVGRAHIPSVIRLSAEILLTRATYGIFEKWRDRDRREMATAATKVVGAALKSIDAAQPPEGLFIELDISTVEIKTEVIDRLLGADPSDPSKNLAAAISEPPTLFDIPSTGDYPESTERN